MGLIEWVKSTVTVKSFLAKVNRGVFGSDEDVLQAAGLAKIDAVAATNQRKENDARAVVTMSKSQVRCVF